MPLCGLSPDVASPPAGDGDRGQQAPVRRLSRGELPRQRCGGVEDVDNADINQRLLEVIEQIGSYSKQIRSAIEDGVVEPHEKTAINDELYLSISKLQEHAALVYKIFCVSESSDARECAAPGAVACRDCGETNA